MPERCIDASVAVKWFVQSEPFRDKAIKLLKESLASGYTLIAPPLWEQEIDSVILTRLMAQLVNPDVADRTFALAALVELRGCEFWTADRVFYNAVSQFLSYVHYIANYP